MNTPQCNLIIDSTCDLPRELWDKPGVTMLHFTYTEGDDTFVDDLFETRTPHDFYEWMRGGAAPLTSQPTQAEFEEAFQQAIESGVPTVYLAFGHALSGCYDGAMIARDRMVELHGPDIKLYVVDTMLPCTPQGLLVAEALRLRDNGMTAEELVAWAEEARYFVNVMFMVDGFESLAHGGRIPAGVAFAGDKLDMKPMLSIDIEGALTFVGMARGRKKGIKRLLDYFASNHSTDGDALQVATGSADCPHDAERFASMLRGVDERVVLIEHVIGPTIGSHVGPGMISVAFWGPDRREKMSISDRIANKVKSSQGSLNPGWGRY